MPRHRVFRAALATADALPAGVDAASLRAQVDRALDDRPAARTDAPP